MTVISLATKNLAMKPLMAKVLKMKSSSVKILLTKCGRMRKNLTAEIAAVNKYMKKCNGTAFNSNIKISNSI